MEDHLYMSQEVFEDMIRDAQAEAWDRGFRAGESFAAWGSSNTTNPYDK